MKTISQRLLDHLSGDGILNDAETDGLYREAHGITDGSETDLETVEQWARETIERAAAHSISEFARLNMGNWAALEAFALTYNLAITHVVEAVQRTRLTDSCQRLPSRHLRFKEVQMTPERQQAAIAEVMPKGFLEGLRWNYGGQWIVFDPLSDLNAMHEAERLLTDEQWPEYREQLRTVSLGGIRMVSQWCKADLHPTAAQRAEAFCRTIPSKQNLALSIWEWHERTTSMSATH